MSDEASDQPKQRSPLRVALLLAAVVLFSLGVVLATGLLAGSGGEIVPTALPEVPVTPSDLIEKPAYNSPTLAVDPTDSRFVVTAHRRDAPFDCHLQVSGNGGRAWLTAAPVPKLPEGAATCYAPEIAFAPDGTLYYMFVGLKEPGSSPMGVYVTTSSDRARTFSPPRRILGPERYMVRMALDPVDEEQVRLHFVWLEARSDPPLGGLGPPPNPIMAAYSDDGGRTLSKPVQVSDPRRELVVAPAVDIGPGGEVHVAYYDLQEDLRDYQGLEGPTWEGDWSLVATFSSDGGRTFRRGSVVESKVTPPQRVMLIFTMPPPSIVASRGDSVHVAWHDGRNGDWDVFHSASRNSGSSWTRANRVNDDPMKDSRNQYLPRISAAPDGRLDMIFYDRRGNVENRGNDVFYAFSQNDGATFSRNLKLTSLDSDSRIGPRYLVPSGRGLIEFGGRLGLVSQRSGALAAWTDTRNTGRGAPAQEIFATRINHRNSDSSGRPRLLGAGIAAAGLLLLAAVSFKSRAGKT